MPNDLMLKLVDVGAVGLMLALSLTALVWTTRTLLDFMKERISFYEQGLLTSLQGILSYQQEHDRQSAAAHKRQDETMDRIEREVAATARKVA